MKFFFNRKLLPLYIPVEPIMPHILETTREQTEHDFFATPNIKQLEQFSQTVSGEKEKTRGEASIG